MDELNQLASLGLVLPSPAYIAGAILFGLIGYAAFRRGRKTSTASLTWTGAARRGVDALSVCRAANLAALGGRRGFVRMALYPVELSRGQPTDGRL
ncbi:hypothetical protein RCH06_003486 [Polaromonas sp. CG_9.5]|uniref:hypothetical protein n=1 Tax=Polaromonas sp. CG_9.5 TaxID=3071705 RepID=UPI002E05A0CC|nr:hypothetical protein [Polaromonas sp. CG_9.5]